MLYNTDDHTYSIDISVRDGRNYWFHSDKREVELRQYVQALFSPGGDLYAYRAENDLYSDYEKYTAVWNWIKNNISYGGTHSAWQGIVRGGTFCDGYSAANALLCAYAGVDSVSVVGTIPQGPHAWNWVRIGEKWYTSDSTANNLSDGAFLLRSDENGKDTFYVLDEEQEPPEIQAQYPRYSVGYKDELEKGNKIDSGRVGDNLIWTLWEGVLTISGEGEMRDFEDPYLVPWRSSTEYIKKVVIKEGVTSIGANAFYDLENIKKDDPDTADIAGSVETVGEHAFYDPNDPVTEFASRLELKSNLTIQYGGARLTKNDVIQEGFYGNTEAENSDFEFKYSADNGANWTSGLPENVGTYVIEATLKAKNTGGLTYHSSTETAAVTITKADFHVTSIHAKAGRYYDGTTDVDIESAFADYSHWNNQNLRLGVDYKITAQYVSPEAGTGKAYITVTPLDTVRMNNYNVTYSKDAVSTYYNIRKKPLEVDMFEPIPAQPFTGGQVRPLVTIASSEEAIMTYDDFTVSYEKNVDPGTGYVVVTGKNNYTEVRIPFEIDDSLQVEPTITPMNSSGVVIKGFNYPETFKVQLQQVQDQAGQAVNLYYLENGNSLSSEPLATAAVNADGAAEFTVNSGDKKMLAGPQTLVAMSAANEELARVSVVLNAVKVTATPSGDILALKMYDGTTKVLTEEEGGRRYDVKLDLSNIVEGDDVSASFDCEYSTPDIGANMLLFTNIKLTGKDFAYYHLTNTQANFGDPSGSSIEQLGGQVWIYRADLTPVITLGEKIYDGTSDVPITEINWEGLVGDHTLRQTTDYTLEASYDETDAGEQTITVAIKLLETPAAAYYRLADEYFESFEITGTIKQKALTEDMFADIGEQAYTGKKIEPAVKAADTEPLLTDENYTVSYGENISGSGTVTITGRKNYTGEVTLTFPITDGVAKPDLSAAAYSGSAQTSSFTYGDIITIKGNALKDGAAADGKVSLYSGERQLGEAVGVGSDGSYEIRYRTVDKAIPASGEETGLELRLTDGDSSDILATANVSVALSPKQVTASLTGNATKVYDAGTALPETHTVRVVLDGVLNGDANALSATADYQFENASAGTKTVTASDIALVDVDPTMGVAGFYELQGSTELTVQVAGGITPLALTEDMFVPIGDQSYTADPITPEVVLTDAYKSILSDADYNLDYNNNTEAGTATVTVTGQGNAQGSVTLTFTINALETQITAEAQDESGSPKTQFTYGDTIRITGSLNAAAPDAYTLRGAAARSGQGQIILYIGNKQIGDPQNVSLNNAAFTFDINTADKSVPTGEVTLTLQYTGDGSLGSSETGVSINLDKVVLTPEVQSVPVITKTYDGTATVPSGQAPQITLTGTTVNGDMPALVDPVWSYASSGASDSIDIIGSGLALSEAWQSWYALSTDTLTLPSAGAIEKATLSPQSESVTLPAGIPGVSVTKVISGLVPDNAGGAPVYEVTDYSENGLISASINEQGELILTAKDETDTSMADTVTVKVSGLANYSDITIEVAVAFANQTPVTIELTLSQTTLTYTAQQIQGYSAVNATYTDANGTTQTYTDALSYVYEGTTLEGAAYGPTSTAPTQAGSYTVTASVPETALMYTGSVSRNFTIAPAPLVIRADTVQIVQGQALPALTYTVEGLMGGDTLIKEPVLTPSGLDTSLPGTYIIAISGAQASANYTIAEYVNAVLTITEAPAPDPQVPPASGTAIPPETGDSSGFETNISALAGALVISVLAGLWIKRSRIRRKG